MNSDVAFWLEKKGKLKEVIDFTVKPRGFFFLSFWRNY